MYIKSIRKYHKIKGKRVLLRAGLNVSVKDEKVLDDFRLEKQLSTIRFLRIQGAKIIIIGHLGRPKDGVYSSSYSLLPVARYFEKKLNSKINFVPGKINIKSSSAVAKMKEGDIVVFDNLRFNKGERSNSKRFAKALAGLADIYVCDAFANSHRAHASMDAIKKYLPAYAGLLLEQELKNLHLLMNPCQPLVVILGGSKIATKLPLVNEFKNKAYRIIIGGALANNFLLINNYEIGKSLTDKSSLIFAKRYKKKNLLLPIDVVTTKNNKSSKGVIKKINEIEKDDYVFDIGPKTVKFYVNTIKKANTIIWNGPMGFFETKAFRHGTAGISQAIAARSRGHCFGVAGGGETVEALKIFGLENNLDWVSTGGGAMLAFLGKKEMPGLSKIIH